MATLVDKVEKALNDFKVLTITTLLKDAAGVETEMKTEINLLEGDIQTHFPTDAFKPENKSLLDYHLGREKEGYKIIEDNIATLKTLLKLLKENV